MTATRFEVDGHVATVWLHRPHRHNAWTGRMHGEYRRILGHLDSAAEVRVVVVTGTPPAFCVGGDSEALAEHAERGNDDDDGLADAPARPGGALRPELEEDFAFPFGMRLPVIAAITGACSGVGPAVALFADGSSVRPRRSARRQRYTDLLRHDPAAAIGDAQRLLGEATATAECREGVAPPREKRAPRF